MTGFWAGVIKWNFSPLSPGDSTAFHVLLSSHQYHHHLVNCFLIGGTTYNLCPLQSATPLHISATLIFPLKLPLLTYLLRMPLVSHLSTAVAQLLECIKLLGFYHKCNSPHLQVGYFWNGGLRICSNPRGFWFRWSSGSAWGRPGIKLRVQVSNLPPRILFYPTSLFSVLINTSLVSAKGDISLSLHLRITCFCLLCLFVYVVFSLSSASLLPFQQVQIVASFSLGSDMS